MVKTILINEKIHSLLIYFKLMLKCSSMNNLLFILLEEHIKNLTSDEREHLNIYLNQDLKENSNSSNL